MLSVNLLAPAKGMHQTAILVFGELGLSLTKEKSFEAIF